MVGDAVKSVEKTQCRFAASLDALDDEIFRVMTSFAPPVPGVTEIFRGVRPVSELCPGEHAYAYLRALGLAHMDAHLKELAAAGEFLEGTLEETFASRGIEIELVLA